MSEKSVKELLANVHDVSSEALGTNKKSGGLLKSLWKDYVYDDGSTSTEHIDENTTEGLKEIGYPTINGECSLPITDNAGNTSFEDIYKDANIQSTMSIDELEVMLNSDDLKAQAPSLKQVAINFALKQKGITIKEPITDAATRDSALDGYATMLAKRATGARQDNDAKVESINQEVETFINAKQAEIDALKADTLAKDNDYHVFMQRKTVEEQRLADIVTPFLNGELNPVTVGNEPDGTITLDQSTGKAVVKDQTGKVVGNQG